MKKWTAYMAIISLLLVGTFVTYKQAFARPYDCGYVEDMCVGLCNADFILGQCQDCGTYIRCEWSCINIPEWPYWPWTCPWYDDVYFGICWL